MAPSRQKCCCELPGPESKILGNRLRIEFSKAGARPGGFGLSRTWSDFITGNPGLSMPVRRRRRIAVSHQRLGSFRGQDDGDDEAPFASAGTAGRSESAGLAGSPECVELGADFADGLVFALALTFEELLVGTVLALVSGSDDFNLSAAELMQKRQRVRVGPSSKTCPKWARQRRHITSTRGSISP
jgi:hypothetical protein